MDTSDRSPRFAAALTRYDVPDDPDDDRDFILPENLGKVHALKLDKWERASRLRHPELLSYFEEAVCGYRVKVRMPLDFDEADEDACQTCVVAVHESLERFRQRMSD